MTDENMTDEPVTEEHKWAAACHASAALMFAGVPFGILAGLNIVGPLAIWYLKRRGSEFIDHSGKEAVNFQVLMALIGIVPMVFVPLIQIPLMIVWALINVALIFVATVKAVNGVAYRYPVSIRFIR